MATSGCQVSAFLCITVIKAHEKRHSSCDVRHESPAVQTGRMGSKSRLQQEAQTAAHRKHAESMSA